MSFPKYPEYKHTSVNWLEATPESWNLLQGKRVFSQRKERTFSEDQQLAASQVYGVIPQKKMMEMTGNKVMLALGGTNSFRRVAQDDFVISLRSFEGGIEHSAYNGCVSPAYTVLAPNRTIHPWFYRYLLKSRPYVSALQASTDSLRDGKSITFEQFGVIALPYPSVSEQRQIARFLDHETAKIDTLIHEQKRLIELLKEKRQAVISHAVTKGLDPDVPMKDSGVEWLGAVPAHWKVTHLKYAASSIVDCPHETPIYDPDGDYLVIRTADVASGRLRSKKKMYRLTEEQYQIRTRRKILSENDIVYGREGERWGHAALVPESNVYCLGQRMMQLQASRHLDPRFLMLQLNTNNIYRQGEVDTVGATSPHVNISTIRNYALTEPPIMEQSNIADFLDDSIWKADQLIVQAENMATLLNERRSALISAAVTGKIDVRDWQSPESEKASNEKVRQAGMETTA
jgi:type I restriction enzyme S subunit